ncbi:cell division protein ZapA [Salinibacter ruber]|uniref:cell division protein ZapA n=1 Tax=Salinibacter ruber TaxID=146919 RepID=UPI002073832D|nr:cell division protein ZapA [Salinibacter ruber]MCS3630074.1 cell division protein ZapA [Salinibacter ruber]MCS3633762.1 cell division protein ZapA [Salinibacter ruber]MCS3712462.1 cell division protein ZapA [Salinibacter ruber]MCS3829034.1 cell division protein ZapA [Salinibacter ruber]MCS4048728.1 cell division protein ZapA [Salinibacter ruber]
MADPEPTKSIRVRILGREYALRVREDDEAHTRRIASSVDARMRQFKDNHPDQAELTTAVMTALTLAEELYLQREEHEDGTTALNEELARLSKQLEEATPAPDDASDADAQAAGDAADGPTP